MTPTLEQLQDRYSAVATEYHKIVDESVTEDGIDEEAQAKLTGLSAKLQSLEAGVKAKQRASEVDVENMFAGRAAQDGISVDEQTAEAYGNMDAFHDFLKSKTLGIPLREDAAKIMQVDPQTLKPIARTTRAVRQSDGQIVNVSIDTDARGGYSVPDMVDSMLTSKLIHYSVMRGICDVQTSMTGRKVTFVTEDETDTASEGEIIKPGNVQSVADRGKVGEHGRDFGAVELEHNIFSSKRVSVDREYIMDTATPAVIGGMSDVLGSRIGRREENVFANGSVADANCDNVGYLQAGASPQVQLKPLAAGNITKAAIRAETWGQVMLTFVNQAYWSRCVLLVNADTLAYLWFLKDSEGRPAYTPSLTAGEPGMIFGRRVYTQPKLDAIANNADIAILFDPAMFKIRDVTGFELKMVDSDTTNVESYMQSYYGFMRTGFAAVSGGDGFARIRTPNA